MAPPGSPAAVTDAPRSSVHIQHDDYERQNASLWDYSPERGSSTGSLATAPSYALSPSPSPSPSTSNSTISTNLGGGVLLGKPKARQHHQSEIPVCTPDKPEREPKLEDQSSKLDVAGLTASVIPIDAIVTFDNIPSHGLTIVSGKGGLCLAATFKTCHYLGKGITFNNCVLFDVSFSGCTFENVTFTNCVLMHTKFIDCEMRGNSFTNCKYEGSEFLGHKYDHEDRRRGYGNIPEAIQNKFWLKEKMARLNSLRDERLRTPEEVRALCKDQVKSNPSLFTPTVFVRKTFE